MADYEEIESTAELQRLNRRLSVRLRQELPYQTKRTIGYPAGNFEAKVRFRRERGDKVFYWSPWVSDDGNTAGSLFGHGSPRSEASLNIDVQFNVPVKSFHRKSGGAFVRHIPTGEIIMAHRGIVALGHGRVSKDALFSEMAATVREVDTTKGPLDFLLIGELESPSIVADIDAFAVELRRTVRAFSADVPGSPNRNRQWRRHRALSGRLRQYFDEFAGQRKLKGRRPGVADCYHGTIVKALRDAVPNAVDTLKSQAIDLTVVMRKSVYLFEVKTSAKPQNVYTAIGQITAHASAVAQVANNRALVKVIVLPEPPNPRLRQLLEQELDIHLLLFTRDADGVVTFANLEGIVIA